MTFLELLLAYLPDGAYDKDPDALHVLELEAFAEVLQTNLDDRIDDLLDELFPDTTTEMIGEWEEMLGLTPASSDTLQQRRDRVGEALRRIPLMTPDYIADQLEKLTGVKPTIVEFTAFHCDDADSLVDVDSLEMQWTWYAAFDRAAAVAASMDDGLAEEQLLVERLQPGHADGTACFDDFRTNDPYSQVDRDLLGA